MNGKVPRPSGQKFIALCDFIDALANALAGGAGLFFADFAAVAALAANTYSNGTLGVGAKLTGNANGALAATDGHTPAFNEIALIFGEVAPAHNGLYVVTDPGAAARPYVLTRLATWDQAAEIIEGALVAIRKGTAYGATMIKYTGGTHPVVGTDALTFSADAAGGGAVMTTDTAQVVSGAKTFDDGTLLVENAAGTFASTLHSLATAARAWTLPDATDTAVGLALPQVLTNKTLTAPVINGGSSSANGNAIADPGNAGAIPVTQNGVCDLVSAGAETRTVAAPTFQGQRLLLSCDTHVGDITVTFSAGFDQTPHTHAAFTAAGQAAEFVACTIAGALRWRLVFNMGTTLS